MRRCRTPRPGNPTAVGSIFEIYFLPHRTWATAVAGTLWSCCIMCMCIMELDVSMCARVHYRRTSGRQLAWQVPVKIPFLLPPSSVSHHDRVHPAGPALFFSFLIGAVSCIFTGLAYSEFATRLPISGSAYTYAYSSFGELVGWLIGWNLTLEYSIGSAAIARAWSDYFNRLMGDIGWDTPSWLKAWELSASIQVPVVKCGSVPVPSSASRLVCVRYACVRYACVWVACVRCAVCMCAVGVCAACMCVGCIPPWDVSEHLRLCPST